MKKIILMLCAAVYCNHFEASTVNTVMSDFKTTGKKADNGKNTIWYTELNYRRPVFSTKNGNKTKDINNISQLTAKYSLNLLANHVKISLNDTTELNRNIHNALVKYLRSANRKAIYIYEPVQGKPLVPATDSNISRIKSTKDYTIIPVTLKNGGDGYIEIIANRKHTTAGAWLLKKDKMDHSHIIIKLAAVDNDAESDTEENADDDE